MGYFKLNLIPLYILGLIYLFDERDEYLMDYLMPKSDLFLMIWFWFICLNVYQ